MSQLVAFVQSFRRNEEGQDLLEYALLVALPVSALAFVLGQWTGRRPSPVKPASPAAGCCRPIGC